MNGEMISGNPAGEQEENLSAEKIRLRLPERYRNREISVHRQLDSTNREAKERAKEGAAEGLVVLAEEQTAGRGRKGRSFASPAGTGIYLSVLFRPAPEQSPDVVLITSAAAVAVCRAIRRVLQEEPMIKWVNDIYFCGKKVCGILAEAVSGSEGSVDTVVVGIGINCCEPPGGFDKEIEEVAGAVCTGTDRVSRNELAAAVLSELFDLYEELPQRTFLEDYRRWSLVTGKEVVFTSGDVWVRGTAMGIEDDGGLRIQLGDGTEQVLRTGEITLRLWNGQAAGGREAETYGRDL